VNDGTSKGYSWLEMLLREKYQCEETLTLEGKIVENSSEYKSYIE